MIKRIEATKSTRTDKELGTSLVVEWLTFHAPNAGGTSLIPGQGTKILHAAWHSQKIKINKK